MVVVVDIVVAAVAVVVIVVAVVLKSWLQSLRQYDSTRTSNVNN